MEKPNNRALSTYKIKKIIFHFACDANATLTSKLLGINRNTINKYFMLCRGEIYEYQMSKFHSIIGDIELDESYFGASRIKGNKVKLKRGRGTSKQPVFTLLRFASQETTANAVASLVLGFLSEMEKYIQK